MNMRYGVEHREKYSVVKVGGEPTLEDILAMIQQFADESRQWPNDAVLVDMRDVTTLRAFTEQYTIGEVVGRRLAHMRRIASVVPPERITRTSEKTARNAGAPLRVFIDEAEAVAWLSEPPARE